MAHGKNAAKRYTKRYRKRRRTGFTFWFFKHLSGKYERRKSRRLERMTLEEHEAN